MSTEHTPPKWLRLVEVAFDQYNSAGPIPITTLQVPSDVAQYQAESAEAEESGTFIVCSNPESSLVSSFVAESIDYFNWAAESRETRTRDGSIEAG